MQVRTLRRTLKGKLDATENRQSDHIYFFVPVADGLIRAAKISHSARDQLSFHVISDTAKRLRLRKSELEDLVACRLSRDEFVRLYADRGLAT